MDEKSKFSLVGFLLASITSFLSLIGSVFKWIWRQVVGETHWTPPVWLQAIFNSIMWYLSFLNRHRIFASLHLIIPLAVLLGGYAVLEWQKSQPKPVQTGYTLIAPQLTRWNQDQPTFDTLKVRFSRDVAPLNYTDESLVKGVKLTPNAPGSWAWRTDSMLEFTPSQDWPASQTYQVSFEKDELLASHIHIEKNSDSFTTPTFKLLKSNIEFYQDPADPELKKVVADIQFSHPLDPVLFERSIKVSLDSGLEFTRLSASNFNVQYSNNGLSAYIHTNTIKIPKLDRNLTITLDKGIKTKSGGDALSSAIKLTQHIPGRGKLKVENSQVVIVEEEDVPQQVLSIRTNAPVSESEFINKTKIWLISNSISRSQHSEKALQDSKQLKVDYISGEFESSQQHFIKIDVPENHYIFVKVDEGLTAIGGYEMIKPYAQSVYVPRYQPQLKFLADGNILSVHSDKNLAIYSRGHKDFRVTVSQILPDQAHHYINQNNKDITNNRLPNYALDPLVTRFKETIPVNNPDSKISSITSFELGKKLKEHGIKQGLFIVDLNGIERLISVTDIGLIVKNSTNGEVDIFVASVEKGLPLANAKVELLGVNGLALTETTTDEHGHARLRHNHYSGERQSLTYRVSKGDDTTFIPYASSNREINYSRFDIGGISAQENNELNAYAFSDRRLYRPGEEAHLMYVVRSGDWHNRFKGLPLQLDVFDSRAKLVHSERSRLHDSGFDAIKLTLGEAAITGEYRFRVSHVTNEQYNHLTELGSHVFNVREFEPDRLKVKASLIKEPILGWLKPAEVNATVNVQHLFGTPAAGARVEAGINLIPATPVFKGLSDYRFSVASNASRQAGVVTESLSTQETNKQGDASFDLNLERFEGAIYQLHLYTQAFEKGSGRGVNGDAQQLVADVDYMLGYKADGGLSLKRDSKRKVHFLAIDSTLNPIKLEDIELQINEVRHVSSLARQPNGTYKYVSHQREFKLSSQDIRLSTDGYSTELDSTEPGSFVARVRNIQGQVLAQFDYQVSGNANLTRSLERNAELKVTLDKPEYKSGESIGINIIAPYTGTGLITIERDNVYASKWFTTETTSSVQQISLPEGIEGNAYINVQFFRSSSSSELYMSPLSVAVQPFNINRQARVVKASLDAPKRVKPGDTINLTLNSADASRVALVAVDEGILQVAKFETPNPLDFFLRKTRLQVQTLQTLDLIMPNFSQVMAAAAGGDEDSSAQQKQASALLAQNLNPFKKKRQAPVVWWSGLKDIDAGTHSYSFEMPDYFNGDLRVYAVLINPEKVNVLEEHVKVQGDIILSPNVPPAISPNDEVNLTVSLYNNIAGSGAAHFDIELELPKGGKVLNGAKQSVEVTEGQDKSINFRVQIGEALGEQPIIFKARSGNYQARYRESISLRPASPYRTTLNAGLIKTKQSADIKALRAMHSEFADTNISVGASPLIWAKGLTSYLNNYSHMCTEQLTSRAVPELLLKNYPDLNNDNNFSFEQAVQILRSRQNNQGGFGLWQSTPTANDYVTLYAVQFLLEAKDRDQPVPEDLLRKALSYVDKLTSRQHRNLGDLRLAAWGVYLLSRNDQVASRQLMSVQADLEKYFPSTWKNDIAAGYLAASLELQKQSKIALPLIKDLSWKKSNSRQLVYQDDLTEQSIHLYLLAKHFPSLLKTVPESMLINMSEAISAQSYHSHSAAWIIWALESYHQQASQAEFQVNVQYQTADKNQSIIELTESAAMHSANIPADATALTISNQSKIPLFYSTSQVGFDRKASPAVTNGLEIYRDFVDLSGKPLNKIVVGDEFLVRLKVRALSSISNDELAIIDLLPGGIEPVPVIDPEVTSSEYRSHLLTDIKGSWRLSYDNQRDDRMLIYGWLQNTSTAELTYRVRAVNSGQFKVPPAFINAMYDPSLYAITEPNELIIHKPD